MPSPLPPGSESPAGIRPFPATRWWKRPWALALAGVLLLSLFSLFQKKLLGIDPFAPKGFLVPVLFGGGTGLAVGLALDRSRREQRQRLAEQAAAAEDLARSEERFRLLAENARDALFRWSLTDHRYEYISPAIYTLTGYSPEEFMDDPGLFQRIVHPEDRERVRALGGLVRSDQLPPFLEFRVVHSSGRIVHINQRHVIGADRAGRGLALEGISTDVTAFREASREKADLAEQLRQSQKIEAIGRLAGGVAHDFNNLLTVINGYVDLARSEIPVDHGLQEHLKLVQQACARAGALTGQLLAFSRKQAADPRLVDAGAAVAASLELLERLMGETIGLERILPPGLPEVRIDPTHLEQIIINLALNARDAMPDGGRLTITLADRNLQGEPCGRCGEAMNGRFVVLVFRDTGTGIPPELVDRIFDPFFTTKGTGKGTGLGLSTVYGIVHQCGGHLQLESVAGAGTEFRIFLPAMGPRSSPAPLPALPEAASLQGQETILLVEDEALIRNLAVRILEQYGYRVLAAADGTEALASFQQHADAIDLLVTDVVMPGPSGPQLFQELRRLRPDLGALFISGYPEELEQLQELGAAGNPWLQKPFGTEALARSVRQVLDAPRRRTGPRPQDP